MNKLDVIEQSRLRKDIPPFRPGDQVKVHVKVTEGQRERVQVFEGVVLARRGGGIRESFTVRKISFGVGVERTVPVHAPIIDKLEIVRHGKVRRAKLYYLRERIGRRAKIDERRTRITEWDPEAEAAAEAAAAEAAETEAAAAETEAESADTDGAEAPEASSEAAPEASADAPDASAVANEAPAEPAAETAAEEPEAAPAEPAAEPDATPDDETKSEG